MNETVYLTVPLILEMHKVQIERYGGTHGVRDIGLVTAAAMRPQTGYYADTVEEAAALWESLAMNHGFLDGNKRIAFAAMDVFLDINGWEIVASEQEAVRFIYASLENGEFYKEKLEGWLRIHTREH